MKTFVLASMLCANVFALEPSETVEVNAGELVNLKIGTALRETSSGCLYHYASVNAGKACFVVTSPAGKSVNQCADVTSSPSGVLLSECPGRIEVLKYNWKTLRVLVTVAKQTLATVNY